MRIEGSDTRRRRPHQSLPLRQYRGTHGNVIEILVEHGVSEFGRFASEYKQLFDETPSETFRGQSGDALAIDSEGEKSGQFYLPEMTSCRLVLRHEVPKVIE